MSKPKIGIVIGSVRPNRFADHPTKWIAEIAKSHHELEFEIVDLKDYAMPLFDEVASPLYAPSASEAAQRWQKKIASLDGFIFIAAEYSRGPTGSLKNALDYAYTEWNRKPAAFVGYGGVGGARAVEQLRLNAVELQMAPTRNGVLSRRPGGRRVAITLSMRRASRSTTSNRQPCASTISPVVGRWCMCERM
jgi:NAD(P)H-dependent FMN reductase